MTLKEVLKKKTTKMITCKTTCLVADAVTVMDGHNLGSILVLDHDDRLAGIFTERDIMHCFVKKISFNDVRIGEVMTPNPITIEGSEDISVAIQVMSEKRIRHLPVMENGRPIGVVSYRFVVPYLLPEATYKSDDIY